MVMAPPAWFPRHGGTGCLPAAATHWLRSCSPHGHGSSSGVNSRAGGEPLRHAPTKTDEPSPDQALHNTGLSSVIAALGMDCPLGCTSQHSACVREENGGGLVGPCGRGRAWLQRRSRGGSESGSSAGSSGVEPGCSSW